MKLTGRNIKVRLPDWYKRKEHTVGRIIIPHLEGFHEHNTSHGTVTEVADACSLVQVGDEVFFTIMNVQQGLQKMGLDRTRQSAWDKAGTEAPVHYLVTDKADYLIFPEQKIVSTIDDPITGKWDNLLHTGVICLIRRGQVICLNDYHLMTKDYYEGEELITVDDFMVGRKVQTAVRRTSGLIVTAGYAEKAEKDKKYKITYAPEDSEIKVGDSILTMPHCDLLLESNLGKHLFPNETYYCEAQNILATIGA